MSRPTEQTLVMASSFSRTRWPRPTASARAASSLTGMKAPLSPPTELEANRPPFFTASLSMATAAVEPGAPMAAMPSVLRISPTLSPTVGRGGQREVDDAEGHAQLGGHLAADQLAHAGDAEAGDLDLFGQVAEGELLAHGQAAPQGAGDHARPGDADVDRGLRLAGAEVGPGHEGVVLGDVGEDRPAWRSRSRGRRRWPRRSAGACGPSGGWRPC